MVFNTVFNNISDIPWQLVLLVEETGVPEENNRTAATHTDKLYHIMLYRVHLDTSEESCINRTLNKSL
jgi:hypothetical protein